MRTIGEYLKHATDRLGRRDAMLIICHITGKTSAQVMLHGNETMPRVGELLSCISRCRQGEPLQYVLGKWDFMGHELQVDARALIPRPETELLVEEVLNFISAGNVVPDKRINSALRILDLCTGSGCIAAAIAYAGAYNVTAADISEKALSLAKQNGAGLGINFVQSDLFDNIQGSFDVIVSNPPYITTCEMADLAPTVKNHEPHLALHGGEDGMDIYRRLVPESLKFLKPGGALFLEIGPPAVYDIMTGTGFNNVRLKQDYAGLPRIVYGVN